MVCSLWMTICGNCIANKLIEEREMLDKCRFPEQMIERLAKFKMGLSMEEEKKTEE